MDVVDQAFVHQVAVSLWRDAESVLEAAPSAEEGLRRLREGGVFEERGQYAPIWRRRWLAAVERIDPSGSPADRLTLLREMTEASMREEDEARESAGQPLLIDESEGRQFMDFALGRILQEGSGEIEDIEEEEV